MLYPLPPYSILDIFESNFIYVDETSFILLYKSTVPALSWLVTNR